MPTGALKQALRPQALIPWSSGQLDSHKKGVIAWRPVRHRLGRLSRTMIDPMRAIAQPGHKTQVPEAGMFAINWPLFWFASTFTFVLLS